MEKIRLLDNSTINKIAAGEVIERPGSVIKELVENSIDAGAENITIEIRDGGTTLMRVTDDGSGIPSEDVKTAFLRHATSKIRSADDLESVFSLGFRGEALASIAEVSKVEMLTKTRMSDTGTRLRINGGVLEYIREEGAAGGTSISIEDLFYNVPARKKFLKKPSTEASHISDIVMKFVLGHPEISFKYINNGTVIIHTSGNSDLKTAVYHVYGKDTAFKMLDITAKDEEMQLSGLIGRPELARANRTHENLFINGRFIKNDVVSAAAEEAYKTRLMIGKFPVFVLSMGVDPAMVDVNVHPAKLEVRFRDEDAVYKFVYESIVDTFKDKVLIREGNWDSRPSAAVREFVKPFEKAEKPVQQDIFTAPEQPKREPRVFKTFDKSVADSDREYAKMLLSGKPSNGVCEPKAEYVVSEPVKTVQNTSEPEILPEHSILIEKIREKVAQEENEAQEAERAYVQAEQSFIQPEKAEDKPFDEPEIVLEKPEEFSAEKPFFNNYRIIGQVFKTYWIIEQDSSLFLIDQHAAHERVLFEKFSNEFKNGNIVVQDLVAPERLILSDIEKDIIEDNRKEIESFGFRMNVEDGNYFLLSVPYIFDKPATTSYLFDIIDLIKSENITNVYDTKLLRLATMACKAAVKGGDKLTNEEAESLIRKLLALQNPFSCPHGRPTIIEMTEYELEKKFKRIQ